MTDRIDDLIQRLMERDFEVEGVPCITLTNAIRKIRQWAGEQPSRDDQIQALNDMVVNQANTIGNLRDAESTCPLCGIRFADVAGVKSHLIGGGCLSFFRTTTPPPIVSTGDLLPCPFCGSNAALKDFVTADGEGWFVECSGCSANCGVTDSEKGARQEWNRRAAFPIKLDPDTGAALAGIKELHAEFGPTNYDDPDITPQPIAGDVREAAQQACDYYFQENGQSAYVMGKHDENMRSLRSALTSAPRDESKEGSHGV